jgi:molecular chaperone DnaK (HSP70)
MSQSTSATVGITLGAAGAYVAYVNSGGIPTLCPDRRDQAALSTPPFAAVADDRCFIGDAVWPLLEIEPGRLLFRVGFAQLEDNETVFTDAGERSWDAVALASLLLAKLRNDAEASLRQTINKAAIAVPSALSEVGRARLIDAARMGGFEEIQPVDLAVSALEFASSRRELGNRVLCLSTASGTPEASVARRAPGGQWKLEHAEGDHEPKVEHILDDVADSLLRTVSASRRLDRAAGERLPWRLRRQAWALCAQHQARDLVVASSTAFLGGAPLELYLSRRNLVECCKPLVDSLLNLAEKCLSRIRVAWADLDAVMLLGPLTSAMGLKDLLVSWGDVDESAVVAFDVDAAAFGAARAGVRQSAAGDGRPSTSVGIVFRDGSTGQIVAEEVLSGAADAASSATRDLHVCNADQSRIALKFIAWDREIKDATALGDLIIDAHESAMSGPMRVTMNRDVHGNLAVAAECLASGEQWSKTFSTDSRPSATRPAPRSAFADAVVVS